MKSEPPASSLDAIAAQALHLIERAFDQRPPPLIMTESVQLSDAEYEEVMSFEGLRWQDIQFDQVENDADAVFWFSPEAFCYYLPGFLAAGLRANRCDTNAYDSLIGMLDRSPEPDYWDDFFRPRWTLLTVGELDAVKIWMSWFKTMEPESFQGNIFERVQDTLTMLQLLQE